MTSVVAELTAGALQAAIELLTPARSHNVDRAVDFIVSNSELVVKE